MPKTLTLTIVIPAYNEESHIQACLDAIAGQTEMPDEVIVVDNNSTDLTAAIAKSYPFVRLLTESRQGISYARDTGFNAATSAIISRVDCDARVAPDWTKRLRQDFADTHLMGVAGVAKCYTLPNMPVFYTTFWSLMYLYWIGWQFNVPILWGKNMALRKTAWDSIKHDLESDNLVIHEDQDLSVIMAKYHLEVIIDKQLLVTAENQDKNEWPKFFSYVRRMLKTHALHRRKGSFRSSQKLYTPLQRGIVLFCVALPVHLIFIAGGFISTLTAFIKRLTASIKTQAEYTNSQD